MFAFHNSKDIEYRSPFGAVPTEATVSFRLDVSDCANIDSVLLRIWEDETEILLPMTAKKAGDGSIYRAEYTMPKKPCLLWYSFKIEADGKTFWYMNAKDGLGGIGKCVDGGEIRSYQITVYDKEFDTPEWFRGRIMYQIFPDRFYRGENSSEISKKREEYIIHYDTNEPLSFNPHPHENGPACNDFYGGNLRGIIEKLPYIKSLGVGVIYLNPIFDAYSNHKYDTANYKEIDPMFGTEEEFSELCHKAEMLDIKIILDGVFSHTGADSIYFNKYGNYGNGGAYNDSLSPYRKWYCFSDNNNYESWWGCSNLPNVNEMDSSYLDYILRDEDSVIKKWLRLGASGWRLDVADELPDEFIRILREEVKKVKPDAVVIGEVWEDASNKVAYSMQREYLLGHELDSVMNYPFKDNITAYLMGWENAETMDRKLMSIMENYPASVLYSLMNLIGTHDTMRIKSLFGGLNQDCGYTKLSSGLEQLATYRLKCALFLQMTYVGVPSIYYGDEVGMQGGRDPFNRMPFPWRAVDMELLETARKLGKLRNDYTVLQSGFYKTLLADVGVYVFARFNKDGRDAFGNPAGDDFAICAVNRDFEPKTISIDISEFDFDNLYSGVDKPKAITAENKQIELTIPPVGYSIVRNKI